MSYTPQLPLAKTLDRLANILASFPAWTDLLDGRPGLSRIVPEASMTFDGPESCRAKAWDGSPIDPIVPPLAILSIVDSEDISPALRTWRDSLTLSVALLLPGTPEDAPSDAELRSLDATQAIVIALQDASDAGTFCLSRTPYARLPIPFGPLAPPQLRGAWLAQINLAL